MPEAMVNYREDKILHIHYEGVLINLEQAISLISSIREKSPWDISPIFISSEAFANHEPEAQKYIVSDEVMNYCSAVGILAKNISEKIMANFFIKFLKPSKPTKYFSTEKEAISWLSKFETIDKKI